MSSTEVMRRTRGIHRVGSPRNVGLLLLCSVLGHHPVAGAAAEEAGTRGETGPPAWPCFRGARAGLAMDADPPVRWNAEEGINLRWSADVPLSGRSSPVVAGERLFLTGADPMHRQVYCFDTETGGLLWQHDLDGAPDGGPPLVMPDTGFAAPTPATNGRHVAAIFATGELVCLDLEGRRAWTKNLGLPDNHYGHASSLQVHGELLFVQYDQMEGSRLLALELASGKERWQAGRSAISWSSPILVEHGGRSELVLANSESVDAYDPATGEHLWQVGCLAGEVATSPAFANGRVLVASEGVGASALVLGARGARPKVPWQWESEALPNASSPVAAGGFLVVPTGFGAVSCLDVRSGEPCWEHEFDEGFYSSPLIVGDRAYLTDYSGNTRVFRIGKEFGLLGTGSVGEEVFATPALVGRRVYLRGATRLFCLEEKE